MGGNCEVGLPTDKEPRHKLGMIHRASLCEFQRYFELGWKAKSGGRNTEVSLWGYKNIEFNIFHEFLSKN